MRKISVRISEAEAANDFASVIARVADGLEVVIERDARPVAVVRPPESIAGRPISDSIALAEGHANESGTEPAIDPDFASDLQDIINSRKPRTRAWE